VESTGQADDTALRRLIAGGETAHVEFKIAPPRVADLAVRVCGFANGEGGDLILGVADRTWAIVGLADTAAAIDALLQAACRCKPPVAFAPPRPEVVQIDGKALVIAHIPPNAGTLYQTGGVFSIRRGTHTVPLEANEIESYFHARGTLAWEARPVPSATLADLDLARVRDYLAHPTHAGLLLFGHAPQDFLLQAEVVCVLFGDELGLRRYLDRRILHGTLPEQIDQAEEFLRRHTRVGARTEGFHRVDEPDYPLEALREAVVNAVVHRDYSLAGETVRILYYPDRVEVHSPGLFLPGIRLEDLRAGRVPSRPRNPLLATLLRDVPGGYMERLGSGIAFMLREMRALGRPEPEFREQQEFLVTFRFAPATPAPGVVSITGDGGEGATEAPSPDAASALEVAATRQGEAAGTGSVLTMAGRQEVALRHVREHGSITNKIYRGLTGVSDMTALRDLEALVARGSPQVIGRGRGRHYIQ
jgi:ATP-dependent DNA helicase RecG